MQLKDLKSALSTMTDEELLEHVRRIRTNREIERAGRVVRKQRVERKEGRKAVSSFDKLLDGLSPADIEKLIDQLGGQ